MFFIKTIPFLYKILQKQKTSETNISKVLSFTYFFRIILFSFILTHYIRLFSTLFTTPSPRNSAISQSWDVQKTPQALLLPRFYRPP